MGPHNKCWGSKRERPLIRAGEKDQHTAPARVAAGNMDKKKIQFEETEQVNVNSKPYIDKKKVYFEVVIFRNMPNREKNIPLRSTRFLTDSGPGHQLTLACFTYTAALRSMRGSLCLQTHDASPVAGEVLLAAGSSGSDGPNGTLGEN